MIKNLWNSIKEELHKKHLYILFGISFLIFLIILLIDFTIKKTYDAKSFLNLLSVSAIVSSSLLLVILIITKNFWKSMSRPFKQAKTNVGTYKEERKMRYMNANEANKYRQTIIARNQEKASKSPINNLAYYLNILLFFILFTIFFVISSII